MILEQMYYDILQESPNKRSHTQGAWTNIPQSLRDEMAVEDLYLQLELPFEAVQYSIASDEVWQLHFNRFFPAQVPQRAGQNFGKCRYYHTYLALVRRLPSHQLQLVRSELRRKFNTLAWIPYTESDRMWCTKKTTLSRWNHLPANGPVQGPKIAINPRKMRILHQQPSLRPAPRAVEPQREEEEEGEDE
ncbi:hypothetical protein BKA82DRAFT_3990551 [Pisolithus tinctorius]|nr:hypothetical protein BKA82DRAFT_3990551 [Pisolithus tinctorius]